MEYEEKIKGKASTVKETAQLTNCTQEQADILYYDEEFSASLYRAAEFPDIFDTTRSDLQPCQHHYSSLRYDPFEIFIYL